MSWSMQDPNTLKMTSTLISAWKYFTIVILCGILRPFAITLIESKKILEALTFNLAEHYLLALSHHPLVILNVLLQSLKTNEDF